MGRRSLLLSGILLLSFSMASCSRMGGGNLSAADITPEVSEAAEAEYNNDTVNTPQEDNALAAKGHKAADTNGLREALRESPAGTVIKTDELDEKTLAGLFYYEKLSEDVKARINGKSYGDNCDVPYSDLRYIRVLYYGFDGNTYIGELIVNKAIAEDITDIFRELYDNKYPIEKMVLVDEYAADDDKSMAADNTSAFNFRYVEGTTRRSKHSDGVAIDINPLYNPYITKLNGKTAILPENGTQYADRTKDNPYYIKEGDICYEAFIKRGFTWGGQWQNSKDYQHFQKEIKE